MGMAPPPGMMPGPPMAPPGFPPGVIPDMNYPGSPAVQDAELMMMLQDPDVAIAYIRLMLNEIDPDPGPKYPSYYRKDDYPKIKPQDATSKAHDDQQTFRLLIERMRKDRERIRMAVVGTFSDHDPEVESTFKSADLAIDLSLITSILGACDILFNKTAKKSGEAENAQKIENFCYALMDQMSRRHHDMFGTSFIVDLIKTAMGSGHLVSRYTPNYDAEEGDIPVNVDVLDPSTCFPTRDGYGIETMTRVYQQGLGELCSGFGVNKKERKKLLAKKHKDQGGKERERKISDQVEAIEFWNRRWFMLSIDSETVIGPVEHAYGRVPFVYTRSHVGDPSNMFEQNLSAGLGTTFNGVQQDLANKGQSHIQFLQKTHEQKEAIMGLVVTEFQKVRNPPRTFEQEVGTVYGDSPLISDAPGGVTLLRMDQEKEIPNTPDGRLQLMGPLLANVTEASQMGRMAPSDYGLAPGSQSSGAVVEGLSESSKDKLNLWKLMIQNHIEGIMEGALIICRDHGRKLGPEGKRGVPMMLEKQHPTEGEDGYFELDYRMLADDTCRVKTQMTSMRMQNLGTLGNSVQMWANMGLMTKKEALEMRGVRDPLSYLRQIDIQGFKDSPEYKKAKLLEWMEQEGETPQTRGTVMYLLATQNSAQQGGPPSGPGPMPGNGTAPTVGMPGAAGQQGGAPPQLPGPPPSLQGIP
jgi:hypothetical protein